MDVTCHVCGTVSKLPARDVPVGRSYILCPHCEIRITIFKGLKVGATIQNLVGIRFSGGFDELSDRYCEPGELWRVVEIVEPCPDKGKGKSCEADNEGRCPNQRMVLRLRGERTLYRTCLYRKRRKIFDKGGRAPVGDRPPSSGLMSQDRNSSNDE